MTTMYDYVIIGGGIVGLSTAWQLQQRLAQSRILVLEKEAHCASHQTGHNSGVIHAGVYYAPGSLKAQFCKAGNAATIAFCQEHNIPYEQCGKLLVACNEQEYQRMGALFERCQENGLDVHWQEQAALRQREPHIAGIGALYVPTTGIVDYRQVAARMASLFQAAGGEIRLQHTVQSLQETSEYIQIGASTPTGTQTLQTRFLISCAGLQADRLTRLQGLATNFRIIPFRGEYYRLPKQHDQLIKHLIYPIPDPALPFLGVHLTRMIDGSVTVGPNAVQGWKREGYGRVNFSGRDTADMLRFPGFWRVLQQHWRSGLQETWNAWVKAGYLQQVRKYCPQLNKSDLQDYPAGIRAQAVLNDGTLVHDFLFADSPRSLHVCNAPSPAATSAIPIGQYIGDKILAKSQPESDPTNPTHPENA